MKNKRVCFGLFFFFMLMFACRSVQLPAVQTKVSIKETIITKDSIIQLPADSSWYHAWLECDSIGQVAIVDKIEVPGVRLKPPEVRIVNNILHSTAKIDSAKIYLNWKERYVQKDSIQTIRLPPIVTNKLT